MNPRKIKIGQEQQNLIIRKGFITIREKDKKGNIINIRYKKIK